MVEWYTQETQNLPPVMGLWVRIPLPVPECKSIGLKEKQRPHKMKLLSSILNILLHLTIPYFNNDKYY